MGISLSLRLVACLTLGALAAPALAQPVTVGTLAEAGSPEYMAGDAILYFVNGRSLEDVGGAAFNPFEIDGEGLLFSVGSFFVITEYEGAPVHEGEFSIYPMYQMPRLYGTPSADTSPVIPFAFLQSGTCHAGYVGGYPVPDTVYDVEVAAEDCHADTVEQMIADAYATAGTRSSDFPANDEPPTVPAPGIVGFDPAFPSDLDLANVVYYAYGVAYGLAMDDPNYAFWDGKDFSTLRDKIVAELANYSLGSVTVVAGPVDLADAKTCGAAGGTELRLAFTPDRTGITLAAVSATRYYAYDYDAEISADIRVTEARECATSGPGRSPSRSH